MIELTVKSLKAYRRNISRNMQQKQAMNLQKFSVISFECLKIEWKKIFFLTLSIEFWLIHQTRHCLFRNRQVIGFKNEEISSQVPLPFLHHIWKTNTDFISDQNLTQINFFFLRWVIQRGRLLRIVSTRSHPIIMSVLRSPYSLSMVAVVSVETQPTLEECEQVSQRSVGDSTSQIFIM